MGYWHRNEAKLDSEPLRGELTLALVCVVKFGLVTVEMNKQTPW